MNLFNDLSNSLYKENLPLEAQLEYAERVAEEEREFLATTYYENLEMRDEQRVSRTASE